MFSEDVCRRELSQRYPFSFRPRGKVSPFLYKFNRPAGLTASRNIVIQCTKNGTPNFLGDFYFSTYKSVPTSFVRIETDSQCYFFFSFKR